MNQNQIVLDGCTDRTEGLMSMAEAMKDHQSLDEEEGPVTASAVASAASAVSSAVALVAREEEGRRAAKMEAAAAANGKAGRYTDTYKHDQTNSRSDVLK